jgi:hypothetical protein
MAVKITRLESGNSFLVEWDSLEREQPDCINYDVMLRIGGELNHIRYVSAESKKRYSCIIRLPRDVVENVLKERLDVVIIALAPRNRRTNTMAEAVYQ